MRIGFVGLLFLLFLGLKLGKVIDWSWVYVTAPLWGYAALWIVVVCIAAVATAVSEERQLRRYRR